MSEFFIAGGTAGVISRTCIAPVERIKIIYQVNKGTSQGFRDIVKGILEKEGVLALWRGNSVAVIRVAPYMSIQFAAFETCKEKLRPHLGKGPLLSLTAGAIAGVVAVSSTYPLDTVRARMAMQTEGIAKTSYSGVVDALRKIAAKEGSLALYQGIGATLAGVVPYASLKFGTYEVVKSWYCDLKQIEEVQLPNTVRVCAGIMSGLIAMTICYPFDIVRRRLQTGAAKYPNPWAALTTIAREEGISAGLYRGLSLNYAKTLPNVAIYMSLYDVIKMKLAE